MAYTMDPKINDHFKYRVKIPAAKKERIKNIYA